MKALLGKALYVHHDLEFVGFCEEIIYYDEWVYVLICWIGMLQRRKLYCSIPTIDYCRDLRMLCFYFRTCRPTNNWKTDIATPLSYVTLGGHSSVT